MRKATRRANREQRRDPLKTAAQRASETDIHGPRAREFVTNAILRTMWEVKDDVLAGCTLSCRRLRVRREKRRVEREKAKGGA